MQGWDEHEKDEFGKKNLFESETETLRRSGLWEEMEAWEREFMLAGPLETNPQSIIDASWLMESAACLLWALRDLDEMPPYDHETETSLLKQIADDPATVSSRSLRAIGEMHEEREIAELWHWRSRTQQLLEAGEMSQRLPAGNTIQEELKDLSTKAANKGLAPPPIDGDFPAMNKAYRDLDAAEYSLLRSIAQERHRALNWLCRFAPGNRWSETPTDT